MIPRFHLYGNYDTWKDNIQEHEAGLWARWKEVEPYITYCHDRGVTFDPPVVEEEQPYIDMAGGRVIDHSKPVDDEDDENDEQLDLFDPIT